MFQTCWHLLNINNENYPNGDILDFSNQKVFGECPTSGILKKLSQHEGQHKSLGCHSALKKTDPRQLSQTNHLGPDTMVSNSPRGAGMTGYIGWLTPIGLRAKMVPSSCVFVNRNFFFLFSF